MRASIQSLCWENATFMRWLCSCTAKSIITQTQNHACQTPSSHRDCENGRLRFVGLGYVTPDYSLSLSFLSSSLASASQNDCHNTHTKNTRACAGCVEKNRSIIISPASGRPAIFCVGGGECRVMSMVGVFACDHTNTNNSGLMVEIVGMEKKSTRLYPRSIGLEKDVCFCESMRNGRIGKYTYACEQHDKCSW